MAQKEEKKTSWEQTVVTYLHDWLYLLIGIFVIFLLLFRVIVVSGDSMYDTLWDGDYVLLLSNTFYKNPEYGDIVVISKQGFDNGKPIIKRVIATEGQSVDIDFDAGIVYVDGVALREDYTYNLEKGNEMILGAHMLEVCPTVADGKIKIDVQPLGIGNKQPPARMIFDGKSGSAVAVSLIDLGDRFRMIVAEVEAVKTPEKMPNLPVAGVLWKPMPNFYDGVRAWILAGGAHHTVLSFSLTKEHIIDLARMFNIECIVIDEKINIDEFESKLMIGDMIWK